MQKWQPCCAKGLRGDTEASATLHGFGDLPDMLSRRLDVRTVKFPNVGILTLVALEKETVVFRWMSWQANG